MLIPGSSTHSSGKGRPAKTLPAALQTAYENPDNAMVMSCHNSSSSSKIILKSSCGISKHKDLLAVDTANRHSSDGGYSRPCIMCSRPKSELAAAAYNLCLRSNHMHSFAAEACIAQGQPAVGLSNGAIFEVSCTPYDIVSLAPPNLVIEVMGQQHTDQPMSYSNSNESHGISSSEVDQEKLQAAKRAGYSMLWLMAGEQHGRTARWRKALNTALAHVKAGLPPQHFISP